MARNGSNLDYFQEALACIQHVHELTAGATGDRGELHLQQCRYLSSKVSETGGFLREKTTSLSNIAGVHDIRRKALRHLHFTVKRAETLVRSCVWDPETESEIETSWLEAAVTLINIKEEIVDILLDLQWWTSMVGIAIASVTSVASGQNNELELVTAAEGDFEKSMAQWLPGGQLANELDNAVASDKVKLLERVHVVLDFFRNDRHDQRYLLASHVRSRLEVVDVTQPMADVELNTYELGHVIGWGAYGAVVMVKWLGRNCAMKQLRNICPKEAMSLSPFHHPYIVQFFRYWEESSPPVTSDAALSSKSAFHAPSGQRTKTVSKSHILMELLPLDLAAHMATGMPPDEQAPLSQDVAIDVMLQLAKAMWHLNSKNVVHRDLKPSNVLVRPVSCEVAPELAELGYLRVKLGDFGLAKTKVFSSAYSLQTANRGSRFYGAPEVFNNEPILGKRFPHTADVWSYGMMFSEVLSGKPPFEDYVRGTLNDKIKDGSRPELPRACPDYLKFIIEQCWKYKQEDRPNFKDLWKILRFAQVRRLGIIREDHQLFTFKTRKGVVKQLHRPPRPGKDLTKPIMCCVTLERIALLFARRREYIDPERFRFRSGPSMARLDDKPLGYMVNEVGAPEAGATTTDSLDVIFFEGNVGERKFLSCKDTWVQRGKPNVWWPRDWLVKDFKGEIRVLVLQYDISYNGVESVVDELQRYLVLSDRWNRKDKWDRPIVLVGHSLGCVVIEHLVVALNQKATSIDSVTDEFDGNRAKLAKEFLASLAGCFFYAPPFTGLMPDESLLKHVFGGLEYSPQLFADMYTGSSKLQKLSEEFMLARSDRVHLMALYEGAYTRGRTVVPPSSLQEFGGEVVELGDSDHSNTCKPINKDHPAYRCLVEFIRSIQTDKGNVMQP